MKRLYVVVFIIFGVYAAAMSAYLLQGDLFRIPNELVGTAADPHTFMTNEEISKAESLSRIHSLAYFLSSPLQIGLLLALMGISVKFRDMAERWFRKPILQLTIYGLLFLLLMDVLFLPVDYLLLRVDRAYGISNETIGMFWGDHVKDFLINGAGTIVMLWLLAWILRRSPNRWWLWFWLISIPLILFVTFIQPVVLDPLYNDFQPLQNQALKKDILSLAARSGIPADQVYEVNMSERTNAINAYVNGIGGNARIVLWDTTLQKLNEDEILTVMAHEMGHYVERHIYWGIAYGVLLSFIGFWLAFHAYRYAVRRWGPVWGLHGEKDMAALPLLLLIATFMSFASAPAQNAFSRIIEHRADIFSMKMTGDGSAAIKAFQKIAKENLSPVTQPKLIEWFRGSHPSILDRIAYFKQYER
ncbi:M48 family metallopeptidase [Paenibacillus hexagrammi]|uniref:M48 family metallopeptidase n=1 Tax=Paenibacillus hexagrammi TaxID=2908839 RepID=A0ABY3SKU5_9BACL|nr:M48 family metallopeptidase [Paenibacillus sp. YPD9-1]UJF34145.1 M48 family metallopeptidase [Paenibacillus sp. YPD9-1]